MSMDGRIPLGEAARRLRISRRRAQALVSSGQLPAEKVGIQWLVSADAVRRHQHTSVGKPGRPLTQAGAWDELIEAERRQPCHDPDMDSLRRRLRPRARHRDYYVHPGVVETLRSHDGVVLSGRDAAAHVGAPVDDRDVDAYIRASDAGALVGSLRARIAQDEANVHLHVVDDEAWPFDKGQKFASAFVAWLDLEDREDRAAVALLDRISGGRRRT